MPPASFALAPVLAQIHNEEVSRRERERGRARHRGMVLFTFGPGAREVPHQVDEYVEVSELVEATRCDAAAAVCFLDAAA